MPTVLKLAEFSLPKCSSAMFERINQVRIRKFNNVLTDAVGDGSVIPTAMNGLKKLAMRSISLQVLCPVTKSLYIS